jgi:hypothetical protein
MLPCLVIDCDNFRPEIRASLCDGFVYIIGFCRAFMKKDPDASYIWKDPKLGLPCRGKWPNTDKDLMCLLYTT